MMINDLDETLRILLIQKGEIDPNAIDIRFDAPTNAATEVVKPRVNFHLFDIRENVEQREVYWDTVKEGEQRVRITRRPLRINLHYIVSCQANNVDDQHRLLWGILGILFRNSPLPNDILQGDLKFLHRPAETVVAQPDNALNTPVDLRTLVTSSLPPLVHFVVTLELDLNDVRMEPLVFARTVKIGQIEATHAESERESSGTTLKPGWETAPTRFGGVVESASGQPISGASVRLLGTRSDKHPIQVGSSAQTNAAGRYVFANIPPGEYALVVEIAGRPPVQKQVQVIGDAEGAAPEMIHEVRVPV